MTGKDGPANHPTAQQLRHFVYGKLDRAAAKAVVCHLAGCAVCREAIAPLGEFVVSPKRAARRPCGKSGEEYEFAVRRFAMAVRRELKRRQREQEAHTPLPTVDQLLAEMLPPVRRFGEEAWTECEGLLAESWDLRYEDPQEMLVLAEIAAGVALSIDPATRGPQALADFQARVLGAVGNARRVANDPQGAEWELRRALERFDEGTGDRLLLARLMSLGASVFQDQRRFEEAERLLSIGFEIHEQAGDRHTAGKMLWQAGLLAGYGGKPARAVTLVSKALRRIDAARDPEAALHALHSLGWFLSDCGRFEEAAEVAGAARGFYAEHGGAILHLKLGWLEGRIAAGLGRLGRAERSFRHVRAEFLGRGMPYTAALVALDLGVLLLESGRGGETKALIEETVNTFSALRIPRETAAALLLLSVAIHQDRLTVTVLRAAAAELQRRQG